MVGGGQLARMTHQAAIALGQSLRVLAADAGDPAAQVSPDVVVGSHTDLDALRRVAAGADALTFDHEHVPTHLLDTLVAEGVAVLPPPGALVFAQDKLAMRHRLSEWGAPVVLTTDLAHAREVVSEYLDAGVPVLVEEKVAMRRELSALVARSPLGQGAAWPIVETVQRDGICVTVVAPALGLSEQLATEAEQLGLRIAHELGVVGVLAVELFETTDGALMINELAMRPHNSGHWTMNGSITSQFEQHLRAVLDYPLGDTRAITPVTVMANVLGAAIEPAMSMDERVHHLFGRIPDAHVHLYGKEERPGRKIGHVNVLGDDPGRVRERAERAAHWLSHADWSDGWEGAHDGGQGGGQD